MELSCIHTHTSFCDGNGEVEDFCLAAMEKGFRSLGFSAHAPIPKKTGIKTDWTMKEENLPLYLEAIKTAKRRWEGKLDVYLGLEADFIPDMVTPMDMADLGLDFIIGSVHFVIPPRGNPFTVDGPAEELEQGLREGFGGDREALVNAYWDSVAAMIRCGGFEVLGHPDLIKKNNTGRSLFDESAASYLLRCAEIAALASQYGITVEINTGGLSRRKTLEPYPSLPLLRAFREKKVPVIVNADAHCPKDLDSYYSDAIEALNAANYTETVIFEGRKNGIPQWRTVKIEKNQKPVIGVS